VGPAAGASEADAAGDLEGGILGYVHVFHGSRNGGGPTQAPMGTLATGTPATDLAIQGTDTGTLAMDIHLRHIRNILTRHTDVNLE